MKKNRPQNRYRIIQYVNSVTDLKSYRVEKRWFMWWFTAIVDTSFVGVYRDADFTDLQDAERFVKEELAKRAWTRCRVIRIDYTSPNY